MLFIKRNYVVRQKYKCGTILCPQTRLKKIILPTFIITGQLAFMQAPPAGRKPEFLAI